MRRAEIPKPSIRREEHDSDPLRGPWLAFTVRLSVLIHTTWILLRQGIQRWGDPRHGDPGAAATGAPERTDDDGD